MAFVDLPGWPIQWPSLGFGSNLNVFANALTIDDTAEKVAFILRAPKDGTLNRVGFRFATVTQAPTNGLTVSFQDVGTDGFPDGTQDQTRLVAVGSIASNSWVTTGLITSDGTDTGTKRTVTKGEVFAVVIEFASFIAGDNLQITPGSTGLLGGAGERSSIYASLFTAAWAKSSSLCLNIALQYDDDVWEPMIGCLPGETVITTAFSDATNPDERGMKFTCPISMRATGFFAMTNGGQANTGTHQFHLLDNDDNILASSTVVDPEQSALVANVGVKFYPFASVADLVELCAGSVYRVTCRATGAGAVGLEGLTPDSSDFDTAMPWGSGAVTTTRNNGAGAWTDGTDGSNYGIGLLIDGIQAGAPRARYILGGL